MKILEAKITDNMNNLEKAADSVNNGRADSTYFYVNGNGVSVHNTYTELSEREQREKLEWFLFGRTYEFI